MVRYLIILFILANGLATYAQRDNSGAGRAILFDGIDDYIDVGDIYDDVALPITISAWVYIESNPNTVQYPIFTSQDNLITYHGFDFVTSSLPHIGFTIGDGMGGNNPAYRRSRAGYYDAVGQWAHLTAVARSGYDIHTYLNGHELTGEYQGSSTNPMKSFSPGEVAKIGYLFSNGFSYWFDGVIDELRIWNRALSENEIRQGMCQRLTGNEPGLIGYWNFDEISGDVLRDLSPNGFDGVLKGNPTRVFSGAPIGDESVFLYANNWTGSTLSKNGLSVSNVSSNAYGVHIYTVDQVPSQTGGLNLDELQIPYYGVFLADDAVNNTFDLTFSENSCDYFERQDNSQPTWSRVEVFSGIKGRIEIAASGTGTNEVIEVDLGPDLILCNAVSYELQAHPEPEGKSFSWNTGATTPSITVNSSGAFSVMVQGVCRMVKDTIQVYFMSTPPDFSLGEDDLMCTFEPRILNPGLQHSDFSFTWQDGSTHPVFQANEFGTFSLKVENACGSSTDTINLIEIKEPVLNVNLGEDLTLCDQPDYILTAHPEPAGKTFLWNTGHTSASIAISSSGTFSVEVTGQCAVDKDTVTLAFSNTPGIFSLGEDELSCVFEPRTLSPDLESEDFTFLWQDGSNGSSLVAEGFGTYWLKLENDCGVSSDTITFIKKAFTNLNTYNFISPNNRDDRNQFFMVDERLIGAHLSVFNRWGKPVFETSGYQNDWDGDDLPSGVYFYTITSACIDHLKGTLTIMR